MLPEKPTIEAVGHYYDTMGPFFQAVWQNSIHFGYWPDPTDDQLSMAQAQAHFTDLLISHMRLQPDQHALDVGCGTGQPAIQLAGTTGASVTGITVSTSQVDLARASAQQNNLADRVRFEQINAMAMPYADESFDSAWAFESIFHVPSRIRVFQEMARVVKPGGRVVVADFVSTRPMTAEEIAIVYPAFAVSEVGSLEGYITDLKQAGFSNLKCLDVTVNTIKPSNRATLGALQSEQNLAQLREVYGAEQVTAFLQGWEAIRQVNETLSYIVLVADKL